MYDSGKSLRMKGDRYRSEKGEKREGSMSKLSG